MNIRVIGVLAIFLLVAQEAQLQTQIDGNTLVAGLGLAAVAGFAGFAAGKLHEQDRYGRPPRRPYGGGYYPQQQYYHQPQQYHQPQYYHQPQQYNQQQYYGPYNRPSYFRKRREVSELENDVAFNPHDPLAVHLLDVVQSADSTQHCGLKMVCEIGASKTESKSTFKGALQSFFSDTSKLSLKNAEDSVDVFQVAMNLGRSGVDCVEMFKECPVSADQMIAAVQLENSATHQNESNL